MFPSPTGEIIDHKALRERGLHRACERAGVDLIRWHDLRHLYASIQIDLKGGNWELLADRLGHQTTKTTRDHYVHWIEDQERDDADAEAQEQYLEAARQRRLARAA